MVSGEGVSVARHNKSPHQFFNHILISRKINKVFYFTNAKTLELWVPRTFFLEGSFGGKGSQYPNARKLFYIPNKIQQYPLIKFMLKNTFLLTLFLGKVRGRQ